MQTVDRREILYAGAYDWKSPRHLRRSAKTSKQAMKNPGDRIGGTATCRGFDLGTATQQTSYATSRPELLCASATLFSVAHVF
jgi:hypothetical protein